MRLLPTLALSLLLAASATAESPRTLNNDDSCDIGLAPAATLLLPYFRVDVDDVTGENTLFTITNVNELAQVARVTLWTDWAYPILTFDLYLTGYDVQSISLHDVIGRGIIAGTGTSVSPVGEHSEVNPRLDVTNCRHLPARIEEPLLDHVKMALHEGVVPGCNNVGDAHENATGYATIDVVGNCGTGRNPTDAGYFSEDIRFDNVLTGDYIQLRAHDSFAQASPMVHIRALTEPRPRLERTFYQRFQPRARRPRDERQPLPSTFAVRWFHGPGVDTTLQIWRDGVTSRDTACADFDLNGNVLVAESVAFDEDENGEGIHEPEIVTLPIGDPRIVLPATSVNSAGDDDVFPQEVFDEQLSGWLYLNLDDGDDADGRGAHQNWVTARMEAEGRYSVAFDAAWLGNGCSPATGVTKFTEEGSTVMPGPSPDVNP